MTIRRFEEIKSWQKAQDLAVDLYQIFGKLKDYGFRDQILRAGVSISNNIAEGFDRQSNKEFSRFLYISLGSSSEVRSMLHLAKRLHMLDSNQYEDLLFRTEEISKMNKGLIKAIK